MATVFDGTKTFRKNYYEENKGLYTSLADVQRPESLFIACSDSRVLPDRITSAAPGDIFVIRNVANMVPPWERAAEFLAVSSAIEYAVEVLEVKNIIICGHSGCGGCKLLMDGGAAALPLTSAWMNTSSELKQLSKREQASQSPAMDRRSFEQQNVLHQMARLRGYPAIAERQKRGTLSIYGWHYVIESGAVYQYNAERAGFEEINA